MTVMITGASGFVGLNLAQRLLNAHSSVICYAERPIPEAFALHFRNTPGTLVEVVGDIRDTALLRDTIRANGVTRIAHMAAITAGPDRERRSAAEILSVNLGGLATILEASASLVERFLYVGSIAVFGGDADDGSLMSEDFPQQPRTLYAITKSAGESVTARLAALHGVDWVISRLGRVFGPYEYDTGVRDTLSQIYQVTQAAVLGESVAMARPCFKNWNYVRDAAANLETLLMAPTLRHRVYNLGAPTVWSLSAWCSRLAVRFPRFRYTVGTGGDRTIDLGGLRDGGLLSWQRFADEFGPTAHFDLDSAFTDYMNFLADEPALLLPRPQTEQRGTR